MLTRLISQRFEAWPGYLNYYRSSYLALSAIVCLSSLQTVVLLPIALAVRHIFDVALPQANFSSLLLATLLILALTTASHLLQLTLRWHTLKITKQSISQLRADLLRKLFALPRDFYLQEPLIINALHDKMVRSTERVDVMSNALIAQLFPVVMISIGLGSFLLVQDSFLFIILLLIIPFLVLVNRLIGKRLQRYAKAYQAAYADYNGRIWSILRRLDLVHTQRTAEIEQRENTPGIAALRDMSGRMAWWNNLFSSTQALLLTSAGVLILIFGGQAVMRETMTVGSLLSFYIAVSILGRQLNIGFETIPRIIDGNEALAKVFDLLHEKAHSPYCGKKAINFVGAIELRNVTFGYGNRAALNGISLAIKPGSILGIAGPNGSGKTSLIYLILGFYRPWEGEVLADGTPFDEVDLDCVLQRIGVVLQDPILINGTIRENITYGSPDTREDAMIKAALFATAHAFIQNLPAGYDTQIGEGGVRLSGGQRQRIAIARALLNEPRILILDEPTNHLDVEGIHELLSNLQQLPDTPAIVIVSHSPEVLALAEDVIELRSCSQ